MVGAKDTIPNGNIAVIIRMNIELMVDRVKLWRLNEVSQPAGRFDVGVIEILASGREKVVPEAGQQRHPENWEKNYRRQERIHQYFNRVLVKGSEDLNSRRGMMDLVKNDPPPVFMA